MLTSDQLKIAADMLPFLEDEGAPLTRDFVAQATLFRLPVGTTVFEEGDLCSSFAILASGQVRVFAIGETGREITLYRFARGESCILTASCILSEQQFPALATVEEDSQAFIIPHHTFQHWIDVHQPWRTYVFQMLARRLSTVMAVLDEVAFRRMDTRIAELLLRRAAVDQSTINLTHQQIAAELGSSREVISRILADFAAEGMIESGRGNITIRDRQRLMRRTGSF